ncbi:MAG: cysteine synthase A [Deltaproteobacteria bacterium]
MLYDDIAQTIGRTPVVRINRLAPAHVKMFVKLEAANPGGSVKDRLALGIVQDAERRGSLQPGQTVVEATSGNTGIALALVCAARGYPFVAIMPESFSVERRQIMRAYGAKVVLTPAAERASGAVRLAERLAEQRGWFLARQFDNEANPAYHRQTTGPEILSDFASQRLDYWVTGWGTGGTLTGTGQVIRCARPETKIIACEPASAALLAGSEWKPHKIQGWTPDFVPSVLDRDVYDEVLSITDDQALECARELSRREGIFCGISSGGTFAGALQVAARAAAGSVILAMLPDTGERYLSTALFAGMETGTDSI